MVLKGIIPPVATPLLSDSEIDIQGLERLVNHLLEGGVHGVFLLGTTGEGTSLSHQLRSQFVRKACRLIGNKVPVLAAITDTSFEDSLRMAEIFKEAGVDFLVVAPPYYNPLSQSQLLLYLDDLIPRLPLPVVLYNIPSHTKINISLQSVRHAKELGAVGIKDSTGDLLHLLSLIEAFKDSPDFVILTGSEILIYETLIAGGHGAVPGGANLFPHLYVNFYNAIVQRDYEKRECFQRIIMRINNTLYRFGHYPSGIITGIKSALNALGICNDYAAHPLRRFDGETKEEIKKFVLDLKQSIANC